MGGCILHSWLKLNCVYRIHQNHRKMSCLECFVSLLGVYHEKVTSGCPFGNDGTWYSDRNHTFSKLVKQWNQFPETTKATYFKLFPESNVPILQWSPGFLSHPLPMGHIEGYHGKYNSHTYKTMPEALPLSLFLSAYDAYIKSRNSLPSVVAHVEKLESMCAAYEEEIRQLKATIENLTIIK